MKANVAVAILVSLFILFSLFAFTVDARQIKHSINGIIFNDLNGDGKQDTAEHGIANIIVKLFNSGNEMVAQTTTTQHGYYEFWHLRFGNYTLVAEVLVGYVNTTARSVSATVDSKTDTISINFGDAQGATICGLTYGAYNNGQTTVIYVLWSDITVVLNDSRGTVWEIPRTGLDGSFQFTDLTPGEYTISAYYLCGEPMHVASITPADRLTVTVHPGQTLNVTSTYAAFNISFWPANI